MRTNNSPAPQYIAKVERRRRRRRRRRRSEEEDDDGLLAPPSLPLLSFSRPDFSRLASPRPTVYPPSLFPFPPPFKLLPLAIAASLPPLAQRGVVSYEPPSLPPLSPKVFGLFPPHLFFLPRRSSTQSRAGGGGIALVAGGGGGKGRGGLLASSSARRGWRERTGGGGRMWRDRSSTLALPFSLPRVERTQHVCERNTSIPHPPPSLFHPSSLSLMHRRKSASGRGTTALTYVLFYTANTSC